MAIIIQHHNLPQYSHLSNHFYTSCPNNIIHKYIPSLFCVTIHLIVSGKKAHITTMFLLTTLSQSHTHTSSISCEISTSSVLIADQFLPIRYTLKDFRYFSTEALITYTLYQQTIYLLSCQLPTLLVLLVYSSSIYSTSLGTYSIFDWSRLI